MTQIEEMARPTCITACSALHRPLHLNSLALLFFTRLKLELVIQKTNDLHVDGFFDFDLIRVCIPLSELQWQVCIAYSLM